MVARRGSWTAEAPHSPGAGLRPAVLAGHSGIIAERLNEPPSALGPARAELIAKGLNYAPKHGRVAFTDPGTAAHHNSRPEPDNTSQS